MSQQTTIVPSLGTWRQKMRQSRRNQEWQEERRKGLGLQMSLLVLLIPPRIILKNPGSDNGHSISALLSLKPSLKCHK
jgi:hypothetical protein